MALMLQNDLPMPLRQSGRREVVLLFRESIERLSGAWTEAIDRQQTASHDLRQHAKGTLDRVYRSLVPITFTSPRFAMTFSAESEAHQKCVIAAERYRLKYGRFPEALTDIEPLLFGRDPESVKSRLTGPFSNQP